MKHLFMMSLLILGVFTQIGNYGYYKDSNISITSSRIGNYDYYSVRTPSGYSSYSGYRIGNFYYLK